MAKEIKEEKKDNSRTISKARLDSILHDAKNHTCTRLQGNRIILDSKEYILQD